MGEINFTCSNCKAQISANTNLAGTHVECPSCNTSVPVPMPRLQPGVTIAGFKIERLLGTGAMGEVWLAYQPSMDRYVAVKILAPQLTRDPEFVSRFMEELKTAGKLEHPNIVTAFHAGEENGIYFMAVSYVDGIEVSKKLEKEGIIPEKKALEIIKGVAKALKYAWDEFKILHRDIKPSNIMIDKNGVPKLMDMGISKSMAKSSSITLTGTILGTPFYMSPEQAQAERDLDCRADIYALGITLFELLTGKVPFSASSPMAILYKHIHDPLPTPKILNPDISAECDALIKIMCAKKREDRQQSWDDVIRDIDCVLAGRFPETQSPAVTEAERTGRKSTGIKKALLIGGTVAACVLFLLILIISSISENNKDKSKLKNSADKQIPRNKLTSDSVKTESSDKKNTKAFSIASSNKKINENNYNKSGNKKIRHTTTPQSQNKVKEVFDFAVDFAKKHPMEFKLAIGNFEKVEKLFPKTKYALMAGMEKEKLEKKRREFIDKQIAEIMSDLKNKSEQFASKHEYKKAIALLHSYSGKYKNETLKRRRQLIAQYKKAAELFESQKKREMIITSKKYREYLGSLSSNILKRKLKTSLKLTEKELKKNDLKLYKKQITAHKDILQKILKVNDLLIAELRKNIGRKIAIETTKGNKIFTIKKIKGRTIYVEKESAGNIKVQTILSLRSISIKERIRILKKDSADAALLLAGIAAYNKKYYTSAVSAFGKIKTPDIGNALVKKVYGKQNLKYINMLQDSILEIANRTGEDIKKFSLSLIKEHVNKIKKYPPDISETDRQALSQLIKEIFSSPEMQFLKKYYDSGKLAEYIAILKEFDRILRTKSRSKDVKILEAFIHGDIKKFDAKTLAVEVVYDFSDPIQLADWKFMPIEQMKENPRNEGRPRRFVERFRNTIKRFVTYKIANNQLLFRSKFFSVLIYKVKFAMLKVKVAGYYTLGNYGLFLNYRNKSLLFFIALNGDKDAYLFHDEYVDREGRVSPPEAHIIGNTDTEPNSPFLSYLFWKNRRAKLIIQTYKGKPEKKKSSRSYEKAKMKTTKWDPLDFDAEWVQFGIGIKQTKNYYKEIHIKGVLDRAWVEENLPQLAR